MEKKIYNRDNDSINNVINQLNELSNTIENNLFKLSEFNKISSIFDKEFIFEITTNKNTNSFNALEKKLREANVLDSNEFLNTKIKELIKLLFTSKEIKINSTIYSDIFNNLDELTTFDLSPFSRYEFINKDSFNYDYIKNKITLKNKIKELITERHTIYLTKQQEKMFESIKKIDAEIEEIKKIFDTREQPTFNNIYWYLYNCYNNTNIYAERSLNLTTVYDLFILNTKP